MGLNYIIFNSNGVRGHSNIVCAHNNNQAKAREKEEIKSFRLSGKKKKKRNTGGKNRIENKIVGGVCGGGYKVTRDYRVPAIMVVVVMA